MKLSTARGVELSAGLVAGAALLTLGCAQEILVDKAPVVRPVKMVTVGAESAVVTRGYPGRVSPVREATVAFEVAGRIVDLSVREGQPVRKGDLLARLDPRDFEAKLGAALADLRAAEADFLRFQDLLAKDAVSRREFESRERGFEVAKAQVSIAEKALGDCKLRAPFSGRVARTLIDEYQTVGAKEPILLVQDTSTLEIVVDVPEVDFSGKTKSTSGPRLVEGADDLEPRVWISTQPDRSFPATLGELATAADPTTRTFRATLGFVPPDDVVILPGMTARVTFSEPSTATAGHAIPARAAIADDSGGAFVWRVDQSSMKVEAVPVVLGELTGDQVTIASGLEANDVIAVSGVHHLRDGMQVSRFETDP